MSFSGTQQKCKACEKTVYVVDQLTADGVVYHKSCFRCQRCKGTLKLSNYSSLEGVLYCKPHYEQLFKETGSFGKSFQSSAKSADKSSPELKRTPGTSEKSIPELTITPSTAEEFTPEMTRTPNTPEKLTPELTRTPSTAEKSTSELTRTPNTAEKLTPEMTRTPSAAEKLTPEPTRSPGKVEKLTPELTRSPSKATSMFSGTQEKCVTCGKTAYPLEKVTVEGQSFHKSCFKCFHGGCSISPSNYAALEGILYCKHHFSQLFREKGSYNHLIKCASIKRTAASVPDL